MYLTADPRTHAPRSSVAASYGVVQLSPAFWFKIYNKPTITYDACVRYLTKEETNSDLTQVPAAHAASLKFLFAKKEFTQRHPACAFWWVFWDDLYNSNLAIGKIARNGELLDSSKPSAIAFKPMQREQLEAVLKEAGLYGTKGWCGDRFCCCFVPMLIDSAVLDTLYSGMSHYTDGTPFEEKGCKSL